MIRKSKGPVLVIGATGNQGGQVTQALLEAGWTVHALTRHGTSSKAQALKAQGVHLINGNMSDRTLLTDIFPFVTGVFSVQNFWDLGLESEVQLGTNIIEAATRSGNHLHVVYSSGLGANQRQNVAAIDGKTVLEERLRTSGLPYTILRPGLFMDDFCGASLPFARPLQQLLDHHRPLVGRLFLATLQAVFPQDRKIPLTTLHDVGRLVQWAFEHPDLSQGETVEMIGASETWTNLYDIWESVTGRSILKVPGFGAGIRVFHPKMAALLTWLAEHPYAANAAPIELQGFKEWLQNAKRRQQC
ncbi:MAG: NmrA/HSCARG family protein [Firmicutes bacterium]|jgi:nucleoside-diphosphate-sugar epimerase|nr:NmrA/HSCARG family protein [Bacillota bacterium]MCL5014012.1 NmrA/HSCARG family protein [Bacillota bacterium]